MTELEFLKHHGMVRNPFSDEDAQTDAVFKDHCILSTFHPAWSKVYGDPREPATSIVLGPKGSGKTAMRLQLATQYQKYNDEHPEARVFVIHYDDFNSYLGPLEHRLGSRYRGKPDKVLGQIQIWDHMDAILCEGVTDLVDQVLHSKNDGPKIDSTRFASWDRGQKRDLLLLAACYDQSTLGTYFDRWHKLRKIVGYSNLDTWFPLLIGILGSILALSIWIGLYWNEQLLLKTTGILLGISLMLSWGWYGWRFLGCLWKARNLCRWMRVGRRDLFVVEKILMGFSSSDLAAQPLPKAPRSDDRYALLEKFQYLLKALGYPGMVVLVDRVDEPDCVNGQPERMKLLIWSLLDNKLLKHPGIGFKLLLPNDLQYYIDRESREFHERARLDKQNMVNAFDWTGESLYDVLAARMKACSGDSKPCDPKAIFESSLGEARLLAAMQSLKTPRNLFRFLYRVLAEHCKRNRSSDQQYQISTQLFETTLAVFQAELSSA